MAETCIHIGLPKAASSYLQLHLSQARNTSIVAHGELKQLRLAAFGEYCPDQASDFLQEKLSGNWSKKPKCVVTDERLSSWRHFDFRFLTRAQVRQYQIRCARLLHRSFGKASVLLLTRRPHSWLASLHAQYIKAGETLPLAEFCGRNRGYLLQASNIDDLVRIYSSEFGRENIAVFPMEGMGSDRHDDWRDWLNRKMELGIKWKRVVRYPRLDTATTEIIRRGNCLTESLANSAGMSNARLQHFKREMFGFIDAALVDQANNQKRLRRVFGKVEGRSVPPQRLIDDILSNMQETIHCDSFQGVRDLYV